MRKFAMLLALAVAFSLSALAQTGATTTGTTESQSTTSTTKKATQEKGETKAQEKAEHKSQLTGCLAKNAAGTGYMLTNGRYKKGVEVTSSEDLAAHIGHEVKLMGAWEKPSTAEAGGAGAKGHEMKTFNATEVKHISDTCKTTGAKKEKKGAEATEKAPGF